MTEFDDVIRLLREQRPQATPLELDRIKQRARAQAARPSRRTNQPMKSRLAILSMLVAGLLMSTTGASLAVSGLSASNDASVAQYATPAPTPKSGVLPETQSNTPTKKKHTAPHAAQPTTATAPAVQPARQVEAGQSSNQLPFTGFAAIPVLLAGIALLAGGLVLRRRTRADS